MAIALSPRLVRRGLQVFLLASLIGFGASLAYGSDLPTFVASLGNVRWGWVLVGVGLASMDWFGGGLRLWLVARVLHKDPPLGGMVLAGGMSAWASYLTPFNSGGGPMMMYVMKRHGVPLPVAVTSTLLTFIATVLFFAIAGPLAILAGAGQALRFKGNVAGLSLYDLFVGSLGIFGALAVLFAVLLVAPRLAHDALARLLARTTGRSPRAAARLEKLLAGLDQAATSLEAFRTRRGAWALTLATIVSGPSHANKLLAGYVALRAIGVEANFVDILLVQTLVTFLLYFAPTPGASGIGEIVSTLIMENYVPRALTPLYTLVWRSILSWFTIAFGVWIFSRWVSRGLRAIDASGEAAAPDADATGAAA
jgi:uncharacterized protein (TIRG00374 family)